MRDDVPQRQSTGTIVVVGSINEDVVLRVSRAPGPGETLAARDVTRRPGGKGANQAVAAARAGASVCMIGRVGDDAAGLRMVEALRDERVGTELVKVVPDVATGTAYITVTPDGENRIVLEPGANARLGPGEVNACEEAVGRGALLLAQLEVPVATVTAAVRLATRLGVRPVVTLSPAQRVPSALLDGLDPLLVNEHEAASVLGHDDAAGDPQRAAELLLELGPRSVVITLGARGAVRADERGVRAVAAHEAERVLDSTGAGDAFAGALGAALAGGAGLDDAVEAGLAAAAVAVGSLGAR